MLKINQKIPDFTLDALWQNEILKIKLSDYKNKWLIVFFYPADFSFVCPTELEALTEHYEEFKKLKAEVMSVSTDTVYVHKAWHDYSPAVGKIDFPMLADPSGRLCREFGTYLEDEGFSLRGTFVFDPDGKLVAYEVHENSVGRSIIELLRKVQAAKYVYDHHGIEVCPAEWEPRKKTLKPGLDLVGKI